MPSPTPRLATTDRAFPANARIDRYYAAKSIESARRRLRQCLTRGDGPALLLGAPGIGKTMLLEVLAADLSDTLRVVRLAGAQLCTRRALLQAVLHGLQGPYKNREEGELRIALGELLADATRTGDGVALLVDEAQSLPTRLLEELRQLTNLAIHGAPRVRLVLAGTHALDEAFTAPELDAFNQRIVARCYLEPLSREELGQYVRAHVAAVGGDPDQLLAADVYEALSLASDGLPRLINQVADRALMLADEQGATILDRQAVSEAWSDLHQLSAPWQSPSKSSLSAAAAEADTSGAIEYGLLDDEGASLEAAGDLTEIDTEALQSEAAAMMALGDGVGAPTGVWDAGDKLADGAVDEDFESDSDDEAPVAYAFPSLAETPHEADYELMPEQDSAEPLAPTQEPVEPEAAVDPFAEDFDEEESVLDPYSAHERVIPSAPVVTTTEPTDIGRALDALQAEPVDEPCDALPLPEEEAAEIPPLSQPAFREQTPAAEDDILIIDSEEPTGEEPSAYRREYSELFASLRQG